MGKLNEIKQKAEKLTRFLRPHCLLNWLSVKGLLKNKGMFKGMKNDQKNKGIIKGIRKRQEEYLEDNDNILSKEK